MTIVEFLLARIAEDEAYWTAGEGRYARDCQECAALSDHEPDRPTVDRMLAECEAKRRQIKHLVRFMEGDYAPWNEEQLQIMAAVYADHPDYRDEWRP